MTHTLIAALRGALQDARNGLQNSEGSEKMAAVCDTWEEAIDLVKAHSGWRPIETAPKGIPVLVEGGLAMQKTGGLWYSGMEEPLYARQLSWKPTHWQPLPTPPSQALPMEEPQKSHETCVASSNLGDGLNPHSSAKPTDRSIIGLKQVSDRPIADTKAAKAVSSMLHTQHELNLMRELCPIIEKSLQYARTGSKENFHLIDASAIIMHLRPYLTHSVYLEEWHDVTQHLIGAVGLYFQRNKYDKAKERFHHYREKLPRTTPPVKTPAQGDVERYAGKLNLDHKILAKACEAVRAENTNVVEYNAGTAIREYLRHMPQQEEIERGKIVQFLLAEYEASYYANPSMCGAMSDAVEILRKHARIIKREGGAV